MAILVTPAQLIILRRIDGGDCYLHGPNQVRVARLLSERGLVKLEDNGRLRLSNGGGDDERWFAELTDQGRLALKEASP